MILSYLKLALRNLYKYKLYSIINIIGLSVAVAVCITGYVNYQFSQSYDRFHENIDRIYHINSYKLLNNKRIDWSIAPLPFGPAIKNDIPGVEKMTRISRTSGTMKFGDKIFNESFFFVDEAFFEILTFPLLLGNKDVLKDRSGIVITRELAEKYFGNENPLGRRVILSVDGETNFEFFVRGVTDNPTKTSSLRYEVLLPMARLKELRNRDPEKWQDWAQATFILTSEGASIVQIENQIQSYIKISNEANPDWQIEGFYLMSLYETALASRDLRGDPFYGSMPMSAVIGPSVTAILILLLACFNYVNTAIASAARRLKEIGIRKVVGSIRGQLITQFLGENLVLCFIALLLGIGLAEVVVPGYDTLWPEIDVSVNYSENPELILFLAGLLLFTAIAAGAYPAFYISAFNPVSIFRGRQKLGGTNVLIRVLLTLQFALSMTAIIMGVVFNKNADFIETVDMGFNKEQILIVPVKNEKIYTVFKNAIQSNPAIVNTAGSRSHIWSSWFGVDVETGDSKSEVNLFRIGENFLETMDIELLDGRKLDPELQTDIDQAVLINETLAHEFGWSSLKDKFLKMKQDEQETEYQVVGLLQDFKYNGVWAEVQPALMALSPMKDYRYLSVRFEPENLNEVSLYLQEQWKRLFPNLPYDGFFLDEMTAEAMQVTASIRIIALYIAIIAILIAGMGLFALVSLNIARRTKELGIRKILGASMVTVGRLISQEFLWLLLIASFLAAAMGYFMVDALLNAIYAYHTDFGISPFVLSSALITIIALVTVSSQIFRVATSNPVDAIRDE